MKRKIYNRLLEWKNNEQGQSAIVIEGARRIGKSYISKKFAQNEYKSYILIDFANIDSDIKGIFNNDSAHLDIFFTKISAYYKTPLFTRNTIFIFDEVQLFPKARQLIKYLVQDGRYDYLETGSLITLKQNVESILIPSEEEHIKMFPMDFEEFLWAMGDTTTIPFLENCYKNLTPLGQALHKKVMNDFRQYILTGGMPQAVLEYSKSKDFSKCDKIKKRILQLYKDDVSKFAKGYESKVISIFDEIPSQLSKKEKKFMISSLSKKARFREYEDSFIWLKEAMIVNTCFNATEPTMGLKLNVDSSKLKCYMADTGLLISHAFIENDYLDNELYRAILLDKLSINEGMIAENIVAQELRSKGNNLYFYSRSSPETRKNDIEIDFLIKKQNKICPIEVKSANYQRHVSLDKFYALYKKYLGQAYILYTKDIMQKDGIIYLPLYMAMFL